LKDYQEEGVRWMMDREVNSRMKGGILADDPGLGKTIQTAGLLAGNPKGKTLIIVPTSVISQWVNTLGKVFGPESIYLHYGSSKAKTPLQLMSRKFKICITSHGGCFTTTSKSSAVSQLMTKNERSQSIKTVLHSMIWDRVIVDEAHVLRNSGTKIHAACSMFKNSYNSMWGLTGTPIQNSENDMVSLAKFIGFDTKTAVEGLEQIVACYLLRRTKDILIANCEIERYEVINHYVPFKTKEEQDIYQYIEKDAISEMVRISEATSDTSAMNLVFMELLLRLRQTASHPGVVIDSLEKKFSGFEFDTEFDRDSISSKISALIKEVKSSKGYCLVFAHFKKEMQMVQKFLGHEGIQSEIYDGSLNLTQRNNIIGKFDSRPVRKKLVTVGNRRMIVEDKPRVLIIQIKAGGVGLNLQQFSNVFILSPDWNPSNEIQAIARAHRIGQTERVNVHKFTVVYNPELETLSDSESDSESVCSVDSEKTTETKSDGKSTVEERILSVQMKKRDIMAKLLDDGSLEFNETFELGGKVTSNKLTQQDMKYLISGQA
jgi:SNF2 family DNA or RNA helicase